MKETLKNNAPIFVVGVPRSGTTLLAAMLAAHSRLSCGTETRFFHFLSQMDTGELTKAENWPDGAVDFLFKMKLVDIPVPEHYALGKEQLKAYLVDKEPRIPNILSSLTEQFMIREGKRRWVEKSPEHLLFVGDIRRYFPKSPIIHIVRDPRDVALSLNKSPWAPPDFLDAILMWRKYDLSSWEFFQNDQNSLTVQYEFLLQSPEDELRKICEFIDESFELTMLDTSQSANNLVTRKDSWHRIVDKPVDVSRIGVWKRELAEDDNRLAEALIGDRIRAYEYECVESFETAAEVFPSLEMLVRHRSALEKLVEREIRFWTSPADENIKISLYIGLPDKDKWLRNNKPERWGDIFQIFTKIIRDKLAGRRVYWIQDQILEKKSSYAAKLIASIFRLTESRLDFVN